MKMKIYIPIVILLSVSACNKDVDVLTKEAFIYWTGDYAADGCGFYLTINNATCKPENENIIGEEFKSFDTTLVLLKFTYLDEDVIYWCGREQRKNEGVRIISIEKL